jgi:hypothetical protein
MHLYCKNMAEAKQRSIDHFSSSIFAANEAPKSVQRSSTEAPGLTPSRSEASTRYAQHSASSAFAGLVEQALTAKPDKFGHTMDYEKSECAGHHTSKRKWLKPKKVAKQPET